MSNHDRIQGFTPLESKLASSILHGATIPSKEGGVEDSKASAGLLAVASAYEDFLVHGDVELGMRALEILDVVMDDDETDDFLADVAEAVAESIRLMPDQLIQELGALPLSNEMDSEDDS